jgi:hypothetical protein
MNIQLLTSHLNQPDENPFQVQHCASSLPVELTIVSRDTFRPLDANSELFFILQKLPGSRRGHHTAIYPHSANLNDYYYYLLIVPAKMIYYVAIGRFLTCGYRILIFLH